jgi:putative hydrolase of the HAD superfamily
VFDLIAFDADDTLWHNESLYQATEGRLETLLAPYGLDGRVRQALFETEMRNLRHYGYGIKSFALSMIETAVQLSGGRLRGDEVLQIIDLARQMMTAPVQLLDGVADVVEALAASHRLMVVTKGDLIDQERKLAASGLAAHFDHVEIVSQKTVDVYRDLLDRYGVEARRFLMVGNSLRSDVLPVVELGGRAVHIPYHVTWAHEVVSGSDPGQAGYVELAHVGLLPGLVGELEWEGRVG